MSCNNDTMADFFGICLTPSEIERRQKINASAIALEKTLEKQRKSINRINKILEARGC